MNTSTASIAAENTVDVRNLRVAFAGSPDGPDAVVRGVDLTLVPGRCLALVGESGSGKSVTARALVGLTGGRVAVDRLVINGQDLTDLVDRGPRGGTRAVERAWRRVRGAQVGTVLQDALGSLDPLRAIGPEVADAARLAGRGIDLPALLTSVGLEPADAARRPGELSGGMRQRALIAAALAADPPVVVADEPTTALDTTRQAVVLDLLRARVEAGGTLLFITHDLAAARRVADDVAIMDSGRIVETGAIDQIFANPVSDEGRRLIASVPWERPRGERLLVGAEPDAVLPDGAASASSSPAPPALEGAGLTVRYRGAKEPSVLDASLHVAAGETLGLVGESGSGKSTLLRALATLIPSETGTVCLNGEPFSALPERRRRERRARMAMIVQDPLGSFEPRWNVNKILTDALPRGSRPDTGVSAEERVGQLLESVHLPAPMATAKPVELSGGQRQRVAIARALAVNPEVLLCDEPVSALDASVQARVLDLLDELQRERGLAIVLVSHDLGVIRHSSDRIAVMENGRIVETGDTESVLGSPQHRFTRELIAAAPRLR
ncbi:MAG: ATP-binding cassette domain-containing protein [Galactobacter sp.]